MALDTVAGSALAFQQYYLDCLSQASYLVGDRTTGNAVVVDPRRDVQEYLDDAAAQGLVITHVIETHFHADFLSGHLELAERAGAVIVFGARAEGRVGFEARFARDGERIVLGAVSLEVRETPGHTPESICLVVRDGGEEPWAVLTGDTLFIGDVGRPDLLSAVGYDADDLARQLFGSLHQQLLTLPDETLVFPAHGAGSACGKHLSTETQSTIGEQRRTNYALAPMSEADFVEVVTQGQASAPLYFAFAANLNRQARGTLDDRPSPPLAVDAVLTAQAAGATVLDTRDAADFAAGHLRGSLNVGLAGRFAEYAGEVVRPETPIVLVGDEGTQDEAKVRLARIGFDHVLGHLDGGARELADRPDVVDRASRLTANELAHRLEARPDLQVLDVRGPAEVADGTVPGALHVELATLLTRLDELDPDRPTVTYCAGGYRSSIAASALRAHGFTDVSDLLGGYGAWAAANRATDRR